MWNEIDRVFDPDRRQGGVVLAAKKVFAGVENIRARVISSV